PQINVPQNQAAPPIQPALPPANDTNVQPIQIDQGIPPMQQPPSFDPGLTNPNAAPPTIDTSQPLAPPQFNPINPVGPPPVPVIGPTDRRRPTLSWPPTPTLCGIPP